MKPEEWEAERDKKAQESSDEAYPGPHWNHVAGFKSGANWTKESDVTCNSGHRSALKLWDCPACVNAMREEMESIEAENADFKEFLKFTIGQEDGMPPFRHEASCIEMVRIANRAKALLAKHPKKEVT